MKKIYECPVMMAEVYETNAYCSSCGASFKNGTLTTDASRAKSSNNGTGWNPGNSGFTTADLTHTFNNNDIYETIEGVCGWGSLACDNKKQSIWKCTCHPTDPWYLEWSHYYSVHQNRHDTFFLYHEANGQDGCTITPKSSHWPAKESGTDYNVAQIVYTENESVVVNS